MKYYIPNQHGAWAMLIVPFLFGMFAAVPVPMHLLLFVCWVLAYLFIFPLLQWIRTGRRERYLRPVVVYGLLLVPAAAWLICNDPGLLWFAMAFALLFAVNCYYAKINRERAFMNDLAAVLLFSTMAFIAYRVGGGTLWSEARTLFYISLLYFTGTVFFIKTMIRERGNRTFYKLSVGYHGIFILLVILFFSRWLLIPAVVLLLRAIWSPLTKMKIKHAGMLEIVYAVIMTVGVLFCL